MKIFRLSIIFLILSITLIKAEPYKPKPILFVHGIGSNSSSWGASTKNPNTDKGEFICKDSVDAHPEKTFAHFLPYMKPYAWAWYNNSGDTTYTPDPDSTPAYPNKSFLEIINFDDNCGRENEMLKEDKKCEEFSQSVKILHTFGNRKILSNRIMKHTILA